MEAHTLDLLHCDKKERKALKSLLKLAETVVEEVILTGPIPETPQSELYKCKALRTVSGFKVTPAELNKLMSSLPNLNRLSIETRNIKMLIPLLPVLGRLKQLVVNGTKETSSFTNAWVSNGYKPQSLIVIGGSDTSPSFGDSSSIIPHPATFSAYRRKRCPMDLCVLDPVNHFEFETGKSSSTPKTHAECADLDDVKTVAPSLDPILVSQKSYTVALPFGTPLAGYGDPIRVSFAEIAHTITSIEIYFWPLKALSYVANYCPNLQELKISIANSNRGEHLPLDFLDGLSDIAQQCEELRGLNILRLHSWDLTHSTVDSFWETISKMSHLTYLGVPYCFLLPPSLTQGSLDSHGQEELQPPSPKRQCIDSKAADNMKRAIALLENVRAIQIRGTLYYNSTATMGYCKECFDYDRKYNDFPTTFSTVCELLSEFKSLQYVCIQDVNDLNLGCLLNTCNSVQFLTFPRCTVTLPEDTSSLANIRQLYLGGGQRSIIKVTDTLASAKKLTHLAVDFYYSNVSVEDVCTLIERIPSLVFLQIICTGGTGFQASYVRELNQKVNRFLKAQTLKWSHLEFSCPKFYSALEDSDIDSIW